MCFPIFPHGENGKKSIWKERESTHFPLFPYTFFPIFPHGKKWENTHFSKGKNGVGPPPPPIFVTTQFVSLLFVTTTIRLHYYSSPLLFGSITAVLYIYFIYSIIVERISCHFWPNCLLFDKSTKIQFQT